MAAGSIGSISNDLMRAKNAKAKAFGGRPINRNIGWLEFSRYYQVKAQICRMQVAALLLIGLAAVLTLLKHAPNEPIKDGESVIGSRNTFRKHPGFRKRRMPSFTLGIKQAHIWRG
jgi:hypothetical protein